MSQTRWLSEQEERAWRGYQEMSVQLAAELHRSLLRTSGLSLSDYEVLVHLSESPEDRLRAFELGRALQWEKSRLSHHLRRMEGRSLVTRRKCESDARGLWVELTPQGRQVIEAAAPHHVNDVRRLLIDHLTPEQLTMLAEVSEKVMASLPPDDNGAD